ncbi:hypothetical protein EL84_26365 [Paenibacillus sp. VT-400]|uniref:protease inhibitor I42 family protein n=1 Tax=Paenibacillus sp. VT-400 TaxID=1495853 RepID=UPI000658EF77|nr:hypothetical protein EL84_26365 [Paenibacillus sp. VT-400]
MIISESDNGKCFHLRVGDQIKITLTWNPSTGYIWMEEFFPELKNVVILESEHSSSDQKISGGSSIRTLTYTAMVIGKRKLKFNYQRPWDYEAVKNFEITVNVN